MRRWISWVRPEGRPLRWPRAATRVVVARGSMPYSAVIQPSPLPLRKGGTRSSTLTVHIDAGVAHLDEAGALGVLDVPRGDA